MQIDKKIFLKKISNRKILIISGKKTILSAKKNLNLLFDEKIDIIIKKSNIPRWVEIKKISLKIKKKKPDFIIAIGGGSVIDISKAAKFISDFDIKNINYNFSVEKNKNAKISKSKLIVIPTTAGSGSEVTPFSVIYYKRKKFSLEHTRIKPDYFYFEEKLIRTAPKKIRMSSAFDALAQALESLFAKKGNRISDTYAKKSVKIFYNVINKYINKNDYKSISQMQIAANLAGKAISISKTTGPHALSYYFTIKHKIQHGHAVALTFTSFFNFNFSKINFKKSKRLLNNKNFIYNILRVNSLHDFCDKLKKLLKDMTLEIEYKKLNINLSKEKNLILKYINQDRLNNNPIKIVNSDLHRILFSKI